MNRKIIVTDLTRFTNPGIVCVAGIDPDNGECIRPLPYLESRKRQELNILPGTILQGEFTALANREGPHQEDYQYSSLDFFGLCTSSEFNATLKLALYNSVGEGFQISLQPTQKLIPIGHPIMRSIITISTSPEDIEIVEGYDRPEKIRLNFMDQSGHEFKYIAITDLGFHNHAIKHHEMNDLNALNSSIHDQDEVLLRLGLSRSYRAPDGREGYWLQANGIYTFLEYRMDIRSYV